MKPRSRPLRPLDSLLTAAGAAAPAGVASLPSPTSSMSAVASGANRSARSALNSSPGAGSSAPSPRRVRGVAAGRRAGTASPATRRGGCRTARVRRDQFDQGQLAQPVEAVALVVLRCARRAAPAARGTPRRRAGTGSGTGSAAPAWPAAGPRSDRQRSRPCAARRRTTSLAMISIDSRTPSRRSLRHPDGVLDRVLEDAGPPDVAVGVGRQRLAAENRSGAVESRRRASSSLRSVTSCRSTAR